MPALALCHVVRTSVLLGPERVTQALKIILTCLEQEETTHASSPLCPRLGQEPTRKNGHHQRVQLKALHTYVDVHGPTYCLHISFWTMASAAVGETVLRSTVCETQGALR